MIDYFTVEQVAEHLALHPKTVRRYIRNGQLPAHRVGKAYRIAPADVHRLLGTSSSPSAEQPPVQINVSAQLDIRGVTESTAADLTRHIMAVKQAPRYSSHCQLECRFLLTPGSQTGLLKVLLFGTTDYTEQMLKHINLSIARQGIDLNPQ